MDEDLHEKIAEWKEATGLLRGGDPGGVEPKDLRRFLAKLGAVEKAARRVVDEHTRLCRALAPGMPMADLTWALLSLDEEWGDDSTPTKPAARAGETT